MAVSPAVIKLAITAATDKRTWKVVAVIIAALSTPIIFVVMFICTLSSGIAAANTNLLDYSFKGEQIPSDFTEEQRLAIEDMRESLDELDKAISEKKKDKEYDMDENLVVAAFYCLNFATEIDEDFDYDKFCDCFKDTESDNLNFALEMISENFPQYEISDELKVCIEQVYQYLNS